MKYKGFDNMKRQGINVGEGGKGLARAMRWVLSMFCLSLLSILLYRAWQIGAGEIGLKPDRCAMQPVYLQCMAYWQKNPEGSTFEQATTSCNVVARQMAPLTREGVCRKHASYGPGPAKKFTFPPPIPTENVYKVSN